MRSIMLFAAFAAALAAKADYWMTFCKTPNGRQYSQGTGRVGLRI